MAAISGCRGESGRVVGGRVRDQAGQQGRLGPVEVGGIEPEVDLGPGSDAIRSGPEVDRVDIGLQDLLLVHLAFEPNGHRRLGELSIEQVACVADHAVLDQLLGDRRSTLFDSARRNVLDEGPDDGAGVDSVVVPESLVLHHDYRDQRLLRDVVQIDKLPILDVVQDVELVAIGVIDDRAQCKLVEIDLGRCRGVGRDQVAEPRHDDRERQRHHHLATGQDGAQSQQADDATHGCDGSRRGMGRGCQGDAYHGSMAACPGRSPLAKTRTRRCRQYHGPKR